MKHIPLSCHPKSKDPNSRPLKNDFHKRLCGVTSPKMPAPLRCQSVAVRVVVFEAADCVRDRRGSLLTAQRDHGLNSQCAPRRDSDGHQGEEESRGHCRHVDHGVGRL